MEKHKMDGFNEKKWFLYLTDHHEGPFSLADVQTKMAQSQITTSNYVWAEGLTDWKPMNEVPEFEALLGTSGNSATTATSTGSAIIIDASVAAAMPEKAVSPEPAPTLEVLETRAAEEVRPAKAAAAPSPIFLTPNPPPSADKKADKPKTSVGFLVKLAIFFLIPAGVVAAYLNGALDPWLASPGAKAAAQAVSDAIQPGLLTLAEKFPALGGWISPIPALDDVLPGQYETLKKAAAQKPANGPRIAVALSTSNLFAPFFYVSSNLPDSAGVDVYVEGVPDTLLNQLAFHGRAKAVISRKLGKTGPVRFDGGKPLPRGEYVVYATESAQQPENVKAALAAVPALTVKAAAFLPAGAKLLVSLPVFLGGNKDAIYQSRLEEFHDKLRAKALAELTEIKQLEATQEGQLSQATGKYRQLSPLMRNGKPTFAARKAWDDFSAQWNKLDDTLKQSYVKWVSPALETEYFYGVLYGLTKSSGESIEKVHQLYTDFFEGKTDIRTFEIQKGSAISVADGAVAALKAKIDEAEKLAPTPNGMPRREGL